jgi:sugar lactone lactonase YvrE
MATRLDVSVECVIDARNTTGESPLWSARESALYWVDIPDGSIHRWHPSSGERRSWHLPAAIGSIGLRARGGMIVAMRSGFICSTSRPRPSLFSPIPNPMSRPVG